MLDLIIVPVVAGLVIMAQLTGAYRAWLSTDMDPIAADASIKRAGVTRWSDWIEDRTGRFLVAAFALFVLGAVVGLVALLLW